MIKNKNKKIIISLIPLLLFIILFLLFWKGLSLDPHKLPSALLNKPVPEFTAQSLDNKTLTNKMFKNKISLLNIWGTWCIACQKEHGTLMAIKKQNILPIYGLDYKDNKINAINYLKQHGNPYKQILFDPKGSLAIDFGVYGTPETFIINQHGIIKYKFIGPISPDDWKNILLPIITKLQKAN